MRPEKLTKRRVEALVATDRDVIAWDSELAGFGVRVRPGGSKTFIAQYRAGGGRSGTTRRFTVGRFGALTVDEARRLARNILNSAAKGGDPSADRKAKRRELTVRELIELYVENGTDHLKAVNRNYVIARLRNHVIPLLGSRKISEVRVLDIENLMRDIRTGKTAKDEKIGPRARVIVRGGPGAAAKCVRTLSAVFTFAIRRELIVVNPCAAAQKPADSKRDRFLTVDEVRRLGVALEELGTQGVNPQALAIIRLWVLTACRRNEIAGLKWSEIDFDLACLRLETTKTGKSVRPLAAAAIALLQSVMPDPNSQFVFPSDDGRTFYQGTKRIWVKAVKLANLPDVTPHTLRHTIGSAAVSSGETLAMTGALLGHANARSTSIYAHMQQDPARRAADRVVGPIATALGVQSSAEVVPLPLYRKGAA